jgi:hypothetical protein
MPAKPNTGRKARQTPSKTILTADEINNAYLADLEKAEGLVFTRLKRFVAPRHEKKIKTFINKGEEHPAIKALDFLGNILQEAYPEVQADIETEIPIPANADDKVRTKLEQSRRQAVKSNAGKIFERYVGYALAKALQGTGWAVWHNRQDAKEKLGFAPSEYLSIVKQLKDNEEIAVEIEGDLLISRPGVPDYPLIVVSIKSTLKDRLHNVTMWQLAKNISLDENMSKKLGLVAKNPQKLNRVYYCLACADIAQEQRDLQTTPRRKIKFDVSFLDFAFAAVAGDKLDHLASFVSEQGRGNDLFHRMSAIGTMLTYIDAEYEKGRIPTVTEVEKVIDVEIEEQE